jgi:hypothetical protein
MDLICTPNHQLSSKNKSKTNPMHRAPLIKQNPKKSMKEIFELFWKMLWNNYLNYKLFPSPQNKTTNLQVQKLHLQAQKLLGEIDVLQGELQATPFIKGFIFDKKKKSKSNPNKIYQYKILRWHKDGVTEDKHLVAKKRKDSDLTLAEAETLIANNARAQTLEQEIKLRKSKVQKLENKIIVLTQQNVSLKQVPKTLAKNQIIGRDEELFQVQKNLHSGIHTLLIGEPGIGKSLLLNTIIESTEQPHIFIDNLRAAKSTLLDNAIKKLHENGHLEIDNDKYYRGLDFEEVKKLLKGKSIAEIAETIRDSLTGKDYFIAIDSLANLSQANKAVIENVFEARVPIIACTNLLKSSVEFESLYRKFHKLELKPLSNKQVEQILNQKLNNIKAGDWIGLLKSRINTAAYGNPGIVEKMVQDAYALSISGELTENQIRSLQIPHLSRRYFDLTPFIISGIACFAILRFIGIGTGDTLLYVIGGSAFVILIALSRLMGRGSKR